MASASGAFDADNAPVGPSHMARDESSSAVMPMMMSAFSAAECGELATFAPRRSSGSARAAVRLNTESVCPAASNRAAMPEPILPSPRKAIRTAAPSFPSVEGKIITAISAPASRRRRGE